MSSVFLRFLSLAVIHFSQLWSHLAFNEVIWHFTLRHRSSSFAYLSPSLPSCLTQLWAVPYAIGLAPLPQVNEINSTLRFIFSTCCHSRCHLRSSLWFHVLQLNSSVCSFIRFVIGFLRHVYGIFLIFQLVHHPKWHSKRYSVLEEVKFA